MGKQERSPADLHSIDHSVPGNLDKKPSAHLEGKGKALGGTASKCPHSYRSGCNPTRDTKNLEKLKSWEPLHFGGGRQQKSGGTLKYTQ